MVTLKTVANPFCWGRGGGGVKSVCWLVVVTVNSKKEKL
jgi:hypothetical protein